VATLFLPWDRTGTTARSAFALARAARDAGLLSSFALRALADAAFALPLVAGAGLVALWWRRIRVAAALGVAEALVVGAAAAVMWHDFPAGVAPGLWSALVGAVATLVLSGAMLVDRRGGDVGQH
jgi:hypothetical protein